MPRPKPQVALVRVEFGLPEDSYAQLMSVAEAQGQSIRSYVRQVVAAAVAGQEKAQVAPATVNKAPARPPATVVKDQLTVAQPEKPQVKPTGGGSVGEEAQVAPTVGVSVGENVQLDDHQVLHNRAKATHTRCAVCGERPGSTGG